MSIDFKSIREIPNDPFGRLLANMSKKLSAALAKDQAELVDNPEDIFADGQDVETKINWHSYSMIKKFDLTTEYSSTFEPDYNHLKLWIRGINLGVTMKEDSGFHNPTYIFGEPALVDGAPHNWGIADTGGMKSIAIRFNRPESDFENQEYSTVDANSRINVSDTISYFIRFRMFDLSLQDSNTRRLFEKTDDATPNNGVQVMVNSNGRIIVIIKRGGVETAKETNTGVVATNKVYGVFITFNVSGSAMHIYTWDDELQSPTVTDQTLSAHAGVTDWHADLTNQDLMLFRRGIGDRNGFVYGDFFDFRMYDIVISSTEAQNLANNKWTIYDIPFGQVMVSNYWASFVEGGGGGGGAGDFEADSFESDSFET